jgi:hypothetical protein
LKTVSDEFLLLIEKPKGLRKKYTMLDNIFVTKTEENELFWAFIDVGPVSILCGVMACGTSYLCIIIRVECTM